MLFKLMYSSYSKSPEPLICSHRAIISLTIELRVLSVERQLGQEEVNILPNERPVAYTIVLVVTLAACK